MTEPLPTDEPQSPSPPRSRRRWRLAAAIMAAVAIAGTGVGGAVAVANNGGASSTMTAQSAPTATSAQPAPTTTVPAPPTAKAAGKHAGKTAGKSATVDPARQAWAHKYGIDRSTMPNLPDVAAASAQQQTAATDLLLRTETATAAYADPATAKAAGFDLQASLANAEKKHPRLADAIKLVDAGGAAPGGRMPMVHVANKANRSDGKVLDPAAPETLMYSYQGHGQWMLVGVMYTANESYPQAPPDPGGPITRWHYHDNSGGQKLMMHIFFVPGNDLAHAYAAEMTS